MSLRRILLGLATAVTLAGLQPDAVAQGSASDASAQHLATVPLTIATATGRHPFQVEVARTERQQSRGLMYRKPLAPNRGMIFPMRPPRQAAFWMKNTPSPLDIIFIAPGGKVLKVAAMTTPYALDAIDSDGAVEAVLEIRGGRAAEIGLLPGDRVEWRG